MLAYVTGEPTVFYGDSGNVHVMYPVDDDYVTLVFRSDENYQRLDEEQDRAYLHASTERSRRLYPQLFETPAPVVFNQDADDHAVAF